jgi:hypothetical protein
MLLEYGADAGACTTMSQTALRLFVEDWVKVDDRMVADNRRRHDLLPVEILIQQGLAGSRDLEGNIDLHLVGSLDEGSTFSWKSGRTLKLVEAGEGFLTVNREGRIAAQYLFFKLAWSNPKNRFWNETRSFFTKLESHLRVMPYKIVIYFMEELRLEAAKPQSLARKLLICCTSAVVD